MEPRYDPHGVEERWQRMWEEEGLYAADPDPSRAWSDGAQSLNPKQFKQLVDELRPVAAAVGREI